MSKMSSSETGMRASGLRPIVSVGLLLALSVFGAGACTTGYDEPATDHLAVGEIGQTSGGMPYSSRVGREFPDCISIQDRADVSARIKPYKVGTAMSLPRDPAEWLASDLRAFLKRTALESDALVEVPRNGFADQRTGKFCDARIELELKSRQPANEYVLIIRIEGPTRYSSTAIVGQIMPGLDLDFAERRRFYANLKRAVDVGIEAHNNEQI